MTENRNAEQAEYGYEAFCRAQARLSHSDTPKGNIGFKKTLADFLQDEDMRNAFDSGELAGMRQAKEAISRLTAVVVAAESLEESAAYAMDQEYWRGVTRSSLERLHLAVEALDA